MLHNLRVQRVNLFLYFSKICLPQPTTRDYSFSPINSLKDYKKWVRLEFSPAVNIMAKKKKLAKGIV